MTHFELTFPAKMEKSNSGSSSIGEKKKLFTVEINHSCTCPR